MSPAVSREIELRFEGVLDRLDDLAQVRSGVARPASFTVACEPLRWHKTGPRCGASIPVEEWRAT